MNFCEEKLSVIFCILQVFWMWIANSIYHSILLFWMPVIALQQGGPCYYKVKICFRMYLQKLKKIKYV